MWRPVKELNPRVLEKQSRKAMAFSIHHLVSLTFDLLHILVLFDAVIANLVHRREMYHSTYHCKYTLFDKAFLPKISLHYI